MNEETLDALMANNVVCRSSVVHTPQEGRVLMKLYLTAAFNVFPGQSDGSAMKGQFGYVRELVGEKGGKRSA